MSLEHIRIVQFVDPMNKRQVGVVQGDELVIVDGAASSYELAWQAIGSGRSLRELIMSRTGQTRVSYDMVMAENRLRAPIDHPLSDANFLITGTGLTHIGSAATRNAMHHGVEDLGNPPKSDSMRLYEQGLQAGKPAPGEIGAMPEWFYKGDGGGVVAPGMRLSSPNFAKSCAEEPELVGVYIVGPDGTPWRLGFTLGNDLSDHETERLNFMYVAPSKLRDSALGPELLIGNLPDAVEGTSRILRKNQVIWERPFQSGDQYMSYSIANLEHHHFRYRYFRRPGDVHAHFFGCPVMSYGDGVDIQEGDEFEFDIPTFGRPLRNSVHFEKGQPGIIAVRPL